jgi:hypothetical protein
VTYNKGGFGSWGLLIGGNVTCGVRQDALDRPMIRDPCYWVDTPFVVKREESPLLLQASKVDQIWVDAPFVVKREESPLLLQASKDDQI